MGKFPDYQKLPAQHPWILTVATIILELSYEVCLRYVRTCISPFAVPELTLAEAGLLALRKDPRLLKLPPFLSAFFVLVGIGWLLLLPLNEYSRQTYVSENALLPGQVHTYFGGSEHDVFRAYRHEVANLAELQEEASVSPLYECLHAKLIFYPIAAATLSWKYYARTV